MRIMRHEIILLISLVKSIIATCPSQCICMDNNIACSCEETEGSELSLERIGKTFVTSLVIHTCKKVIVRNGSFSGVVLTERLSFIGIDELYFEPNSFVDIIQSPKQFVMDEVSIDNLSPLTFAGLSHMEHLWFRNSKIGTIHRDAFHYLTNIDYIYFHKTKIERISTRSFAKMYSIGHVYFKNDVRIGTLSRAAFGGSSMDELALEKVEVRDLDQHFLEGFESKLVKMMNCSITARPFTTQLAQKKPGKIDSCVFERITIGNFVLSVLSCKKLHVKDSFLTRISASVHDDNSLMAHLIQPPRIVNLSQVVFTNCTIKLVSRGAFESAEIDYLKFDACDVNRFETDSFKNATIGTFSISKSDVSVLEASTFHTCNIGNLSIDTSEIYEIHSRFFNNCTSDEFTVTTSTLRNVAGSLFHDSEILHVKVEGSRIDILNDQAFFNYRKIIDFSLIGNELNTDETDAKSNTIISEDSSIHPKWLRLENNTVNCLPTDCAFNHFLLGAFPSHSSLQWRISNNRCRPPISPCVTTRNVFPVTGLSCQVSWQVAECYCTGKAVLPTKANFGSNISLLIIGDCDRLEIGERRYEIAYDGPVPDESPHSSPLTQLYLFRIGRLHIHETPRNLKTLRIYHSKVAIHSISPTVTPIDVAFTDSQVDDVAPRALVSVSIDRFEVKRSRIGLIAGTATKASSIKNLSLEDAYVQNTKPLFSVTEHLSMRNTVVFSNNNGLGNVASAKLENNSLLKCCFSTPVRLYEMGPERTPDPRCDQLFPEAICSDEENEINMMAETIKLLKNGSNSFSLLFGIFIRVILFM